MRNQLLEYTILRTLSPSESITQTALAYEIDILCSHHEITYEFFLETLARLKSLGLVNSNKDLLNYTRWSITENGRTALKELSSTDKEKLKT